MIPYGIIDLGPVSFYGILLTIQIQWKIRLTVIQSPVTKSQQNFAQDMTVQLSCHVKNFVVITLLELGLE